LTDFIRNIPVVSSLSSQGSKRPIITECDMESMEHWIDFEEFTAQYSHIKLHHNPASFKTSKTLHFVTDPSKPLEVYRIPPILSNILLFNR
jgi:hypothetical protein